MEQMVELAGTGMRVILVGVFALTPGVAIWLVVGGMFAVVRRLRRAEWPTRKLEMKEAVAS